MMLVVDNTGAPRSPERDRLRALVAEVRGNLRRLERIEKRIDEALYERRVIMARLEQQADRVEHAMDREDGR